ncbi:MAG: hypothetical protein K2L05_09275, partial [Muribaculaceae bacterium]|nr:hypothetical protein [Muribaculaceae bacterium]
YTLPNELVQGETLYFGKATATDRDPKNDHHHWTSIACGDTIYGLYTDRHPRKTDANGNYVYVPYEQRLAAEHSEATEALYFYENMQPDGKEGTITDKRQDISGKNAQVSYPDGTYDGSHDNNGNLVDNAYTDKGWKDGMPWGSYIEVEAYYECNSGNHPGKGAITYRFMLGKDTKINYEAERNHHYRLTMKFNKNANDIDFHIDYLEEAKPGLFSPDTAYVSYTYNQPSSMSVRATPVPGYDFVSLETIIVDNEWRPYNDLGAVYYNSEAWNQQVKGENNFATKWVTSESAEKGWETNAFYKRDSEIKPNTEFGFLSLRQVSAVSQDFGRGDGAGENTGTLTQRLTALVRKFRRAYFKPQENPENKDLQGTLALGGPLNYRQYNQIPRVDGTVERVNETDGSYSFTRTTNPYNRDEIDYVGEIPLFTRAKSLDSWAVYSGANPFYEHERFAKVKIIAHYKYVEGSGKPKIKGDEYSESTYTVVMQTERVDNPRAIYRAWNNDEPFLVKLAFGKETFRQVISQGPWSATIENDPDGLVTLVANGQTATGTGASVSGRTKTPVQFTYMPNGTLENSEQVRCAVITVTYHNNTCVHKILVRQGYAPTSLGEHGSLTWSTFNVYNQTDLCRSPLSVGSLFRRYGDLSEPILERNNEDYPFAKEPSSSATYKICNSGDTTWTLKKWTAINGNTNDAEDAFTNMKLNNHNQNVANTYRLPTFDDLFEIGIVPAGTSLASKDYANDYNLAFGICYADSAKMTLMNSDAYSYKDYGNKGVKNKCGVRGVIAYATSDAKNIFFPLGASGHARRKSRFWSLENGGNVNRSAYGLMRYGSLDGRLTGNTNNHRPLAWDLPNQMGAGYWINYGENKDNTNAIGIDFNYGNYNGHYLTKADLYTGDNGKPDALPIRPIHTGGD